MEMGQTVVSIARSGQKPHRYQVMHPLWHLPFRSGVFAVVSIGDVWLDQFVARELFRVSRWGALGLVSIDDGPKRVNAMLHAGWWRVNRGKDFYLYQKLKGAA